MGWATLTCSWLTFVSFGIFGEILQGRLGGQLSLCVRVWTRPLLCHLLWPKPSQFGRKLDSILLVVESLHQ